MSNSVTLQAWSILQERSRHERRVAAAGQTCEDISQKLGVISASVGSTETDLSDAVQRHLALTQDMNAVQAAQVIVETDARALQVRFDKLVEANQTAEADGLTRSDLRGKMDEYLAESHANVARAKSISAESQQHASRIGELSQRWHAMAAEVRGLEGVMREVTSTIKFLWSTWRSLEDQLQSAVIECILAWQEQRRLGLTGPIRKTRRSARIAARSKPYARR